MLCQTRKVVVLVLSLVGLLMCPMDVMLAGDVVFYPTIDGAFSSSTEYSINSLMVVSHSEQLGEIYFKKVLAGENEDVAAYIAHHYFDHWDPDCNSHCYCSYNESVGYRMNYFKYTFPGGETTETLICDPGECPRGINGDYRIMQIVTELAGCPFYNVDSMHLVDDNAFYIKFTDEYGNVTWRRHLDGDPEPGDPNWDINYWFGVYGRAGHNSSAFDMGYDVRTDPYDTGTRDIYEHVQYVTADATFLSVETHRYIEENGLGNLFQDDGSSPGDGDGEGDTKIKDKVKPGGGDGHCGWSVPPTPNWFQEIKWEEFYNGAFPSLPWTAP